jgi:hypothetical protein
LFAACLVTQSATTLKLSINEEPGFSEEPIQNLWIAQFSLHLEPTEVFIPFNPFFFSKRSPSILPPFVITALSYFLIGAAKTYRDKSE